MVQQRIKVFARLKPSINKGEHYRLSGQTALSVHIPKGGEEDLVNNRREHYTFNFEKIFKENTKQEEVFEHVAIPVIKSVLEGYNGTIFAYGQTGSGKTYTMTGNLKHLQDRGITTRCIEYFFQHFEKNPSSEFSAHISYLEIYNENGFDLLSRNGNKLEDFGKVYLMEDKEQSIHLKNLSVHQVKSLDDAYSLLFNGDISREISQTPFNSSSTRSHCIFTFHLSSKSGRIIKNSKLHLVDLAGSERVSKTGADGTLLTEAKYINLSLHHLEQVILALSEKKRQHVPYRNCFLTSVLRDSLGGNCMTSMIATCSSDVINLEETVSTCRFAQRVSQICNEAKINDIANGDLIEKLKKENEMLKMQLILNNVEIRSDKDLSESDVKECEEIVEKFVVDGCFPTNISDPKKIEKCFMILRDKIQVKECTCIQSKELENILKLRDNEIEVLVKELKKLKLRGEKVTSQLTPDTNDCSNSQSSPAMGSNFSISSTPTEEIAHGCNKQDEFDNFKSSHKDYVLMKNLKTQLKKLSSEAKRIGCELGEKKSAIDVLRDKMEKQIILRATRGPMEVESSETELMNLLKAENESCNQMVEALSDIKEKYNHFDSSVKQIKKIILSDFETWWNSNSKK